MNDSTEMPPPARMMQMITGYWVSQAVGTAARLGLSDELASGPKTSAEIAAAVGASEPHLFRLMRMLASLGVYAMDEHGRFALTALGETLRSGAAGSIKDFAVAETMPGHWLPWGRMFDSVRAGSPMCGTALGMDLWDWYAKHPDEGTFFNGAMGDLSAAVASEVTRVYDFSPFATVVDVGGAHGILLSAILKANPRLRGILFDLPHVTATVRESLEQRGIATRCDVVTGSFFHSIPPGGDVHVLKQVLHDWSDEECTLLLRNCHRALAPGGKLLVVEMVIPPDNAPSMAQAMDMNMMVLLTGKERTAAEYRALLASGGFELERVIPMRSPFSVIEATRS